MTKILIIEDDHQVGSMLRLFLDKRGFQVTTAWTGEQGLDQYVKKAPDLVILDIIMPKMNGLQVIKKLSKESVPPLIIAMSSVPSILGEARAVGADATLSKPFNLHELEEVVGNLLSASRSAGITDSGSEETAFNPASPKKNI